MKRKAVIFDDFAHVCPYSTAQYDVNNGYGCKHPDQEETDPDKDGIERGKCYCWSCPLGYELDMDDLNNPNVDMDGATMGDFVDANGNFIEPSDYLTINVDTDATEDEKRTLLAYERYMNRYNH